MVLLVGEQSALRDEIFRACVQRDMPVEVASVDDEDLFLRAMFQRAVIYLPSTTILEGKLHPAPDPERMGDVLAATSAPGVGVLIVALPSAEGYEPELARLRKHGTPYVLWECPVPIEELGEALGREQARWIWLPLGERIDVSKRTDLVEAVMHGLDTEDQGRLLQVPARHLETTTAFRQAALTARNRVHIRGLRPWLHRLLRPIVRWLRGWEPDALGLYEGLRAVGPNARPALGP